MEPLPLVYSLKPSRNYLLLAIAASLCCVGLAFWTPASLGVILVAGLAIWFLFDVRIRWFMVLAAFALTSFLINWLGVPDRFFGFLVRPYDWVAIFLLMAVVLQGVLYGGRLFKPIGLEKPIAIYFGALIVVSLVDGTGLKATIVSIAHIALYFLFCYCVVADCERISVKSVWRLFQFWALLATGSVLWYFFATKGERTLGISLHVLPDLVLPIAFFQLVNCTIRGGVCRWFFLGVLFLGVVASQTRAAWISLGLVSMVWFVCRSFLKGGPLQERLSRVGSALLKLFVLLAIVLFLAAPFLGPTQQRAAQLTTGTGTIFLRLLLWGVALDIFLHHPLTGIGLWQFENALLQLPAMKNLIAFLQIRGLHPHNRLLEVLAETGIIGTAALFFFYFAVLRRAWKVARQTRTEEEVCFGWGLFLSLFYFVIQTFYAGSWVPFVFMFFLGLLISFETKLIRSPRVGNAI